LVRSILAGVFAGYGCAGHGEGFALEGDGASVAALGIAPGNADLLLEEELFGNDELFLDERIDGGVALLADGRRGFDGLVEDDALDIKGADGEWDVQGLGVLLGVLLEDDLAGGDGALADVEVFFDDRDGERVLDGGAIAGDGVVGVLGALCLAQEEGGGDVEDVTSGKAELGVLPGGVEVAGCGEHVVLGGRLGGVLWIWGVHADSMIVPC